ERTIRPLVLSRKNALFASGDDGGRRWADMASLIETCKLNDGIANLTASGFAEGDGPGWRHDARARDLPRLPLPGRDHQLR
ncbi:hypothetical protein E2C05_32635, partial [Paracraurococcus ruber]